METEVVVKGKFTNSIRGTVIFCIIGVVCIFDGICIPILLIPAIAGAAYFFYNAWLYANAKKQELTVSSQKVNIKLMQKTVEIPIDKISSIEKRGPYTMKIKSSSGTVNVNLCTNRDEVADAITQLMNSKINAEVDNVASSLRAYQALLDDGIITQEEFDAKKKQLLGL